MSNIILRPYQNQLIDAVFNAWEDDKPTVLVQSHTGSGKTVMLTEIVRRANVPTVIIAHRIELVSQLSLALARAQIAHNIVSPTASISEIIQLHLQNGPRHYFNPTASVVVASVDTLIRRSPPWADNIKLVVFDEAAHVLRANKWGTAAFMFSQARGLHVTATPMRADGRGLGRGADGLVDVLIEGPSMRELIRDGYLSPFRIFAPPNNLDLSPVKVTTSGDYSPDPLRKAVNKAHITGDIVSHFIKHNPPGALGITFAVSVEAAKELAEAYTAAGIPAVCLHASTGVSERANVMRRFRDGIIQQLVNVDILTEGIDVPAVACVSLARPTMSYSLHMQQIGRALRPCPDKPHAIILDHVGNVTKHGLPDVPRAWSLRSQDRKARGTTGAVPLRTCLNPVCVAVFERNRDRCPWCGHPIPLPAQRASPAQVEGNLLELGAPTLAYLHDEIARIGSAPKIPRGVSAIIAASIIKKHHARQEAHRELREAIAQWAGPYHAAGESDAEILRRFWYQFGIDTLSAQTLSASQALKLVDSIRT
jgi:superfamily II DNA or RNA helicase